MTAFWERRGNGCDASAQNPELAGCAVDALQLEWRVQAKKLGKTPGRVGWDQGTKGLEGLVMVFSSHLVSCDMPLSV